MKMRKYIWIWALSVLVGCSNGGDGNGNPNPDPNPDPDPISAPSSATLVFPDDDSECTEGDILSDAQSRVDFMWNASTNTDSYVVHLTDLNTGSTTTFTSTTNNKLINLTRGNPYEWFVESRRIGTNATANSSTWRFYNAGPGVENYAPFPAEAVSPPRGANIDPAATVLLEWSGSDVDEDITEYDVFLGTDAAATSLLGTTSESSLEADIVSGTTYYWSVTTRDSAGNQSESETFEFRVK